MCTFARDRSVPSRSTFFQKTNSGAALWEFKSFLYRMKDLQCCFQIKSPVRIVKMPSQMLKIISFLQSTVPWTDGVTFFQWVKALNSSFIFCNSLNCVCLLWSQGSCSRTNSSQNEEPTTICFYQSQQSFREEANLKHDFNETKPTQKRFGEHGRKRMEDRWEA